jgi:PD-(D/E)XK endonuclease
VRKLEGSNKTTKQRGEWAELCFMARAADRGLNVSRPHGDSASYDVGVEQNGRFLRIQVKSTTSHRNGSYTSNITGPMYQRYARGTLDFFAIYLVPLDVWYIIPFDGAGGNRSLFLTPRKGHKFAQYIEAWNLLRGAEKGRGRRRLGADGRLRKS